LRTRRTLPQDRTTQSTPTRGNGDAPKWQSGAVDDGSVGAVHAITVTVSLYSSEQRDDSISNP